MFEHEFKSQMLMVFSFSEVDTTTSLNMEKNTNNPLSKELNNKQLLHIHFCYNLISNEHLIRSFLRH